MKKIYICFFAILAMFFKSQTLTLDASFGTNGVVKVPLLGESDFTQIFLSQDNKIIAFDKDIPSSISINPNKIYKFNLDGTLDASFGAGGVLTLPNYDGNFDVKMQGADKLLVIFQSTMYNSTEMSVRRYHLDGTLDTSFATDGEFKIDFSQNTGGFLQEKLIVLADNSLILTIGGKYVKLFSDGKIDTSYGTNGVIESANISGHIINTGSGILNISNSEIKKTDYNAELDLNFGNNGVYTYSIGDDYIVKLNSSKNINALGLDNKFYDIDLSGKLLNTINLTTEGGNIDYYTNHYFDGDNYYFVGTTSDGVPFIISYDKVGNLRKINGENLYKEMSVPAGDFSSLIKLGDVIYAGGYFSDSVTKKQYITIAKYSYTPSLGIKENTFSDSVNFENPMKTNIVFISKDNIEKIELYSIDGRLVKTIKKTGENVSDLSKGVYVAKVFVSNGNVFMKKLLKN
ncbi:T9SS type A sorting domain-containing protein [Riemerella anatipestifer]|nr:T9SS type A sorting domain-containing protein [Riemerella anatipestifer]